MKIKIIILSAISFFFFSQQSWSQEAPKLAAFSIGEKAPENTSEANVEKPTMATWGRGKNNNNSKNSNTVIPELKAYKNEKITEPNEDK